MKHIDEWLDIYGESHKNPINKKIHWVCVPAIMFSVIGLLFLIPHNNFPMIYGEIQFNWAFLVTAMVITYYFRLSILMALGMTLIGVILIIGNYFIKHFTAFQLWKVSSSLFILAWVGQFIGHKIEGRKPSFFQDIQFLLIGPAWILSFIFKKYNIKY